jgi:acyl-CoA thioesterase YciA
MREVGFIAPVYIGDVVSFYTAVVSEGTTSVTVQVIVEAERSKEPRRQVKVTEAEVVYVAVDEDGNPTSIR